MEKLVDNFLLIHEEGQDGYSIEILPAFIKELELSIPDLDVNYELILKPENQYELKPLEF